MATKKTKAARKKISGPAGKTAISRGSQLEKRCKKFVAVAEKLFLAHGFAHTSVNEVVRIAGGSLATLYRQYGNKEALFDAVMSQRVSSLYTGIFSHADRIKFSEHTVREALLQLAKRLQTHILSKSSIAVFRLAVNEGPKFPSVRHAVLEKGLENFLQRLGEYFSDLAVDHLQINNPRRAAEEFLTLVQGQQRMVVACGDGKRVTRKHRDEHVARVVDVFLHIYPPQNVGDLQRHQRKKI